MIELWDNSVMSERERFMAKVKKQGGAGCWLWTACETKSGYGAFELCSGGVARTVRAHRFSFELFRGPIPAGMLVCHRCDERSCVRPSHLFLGSYADNNKDAARKKRSARGERHGSAKLTHAIVNAIRAAYSGARGEQKFLAERFGVTPSTVHLVVHNKIWTQ